MLTVHTVDSNKRHSTRTEDSPRTPTYTATAFCSPLFMVLCSLFCPDCAIGSNLSKDVSFVRKKRRYIDCGPRTNFCSVARSSQECTHRSRSTPVTPRTAVNTAMPQGTVFIEMCVLPRSDRPRIRKTSWRNMLRLSAT